MPLAGQVLSPLLPPSAAYSSKHIFSAGIGVGVAVPTPVGRVEVNVSKAVRSFEGDHLRNFQFGIGMDFN